jgi:hypothetical protein
MIRESRTMIRKSRMTLRKSRTMIRKSRTTLRESRMTLRKSRTMIREPRMTLRKSRMIIRESRTMIRNSRLSDLFCKSARMLITSASFIKPPFKFLLILLQRHKLVVPKYVAISKRMNKKSKLWYHKSQHTHFLTQIIIRSITKANIRNLW